MKTHPTFSLRLAAGSLGLLAISATSSFSVPAPIQGAAGRPANAVPAAAPADDIIDIRPPIHIAEDISWVAIGAAALALGGLTFGAWRLLHKKIRAQLPYEIALEKLLVARQFLSPEQAHLFSDLVSEVVLSFIEQMFPVRAAHRTTEEFLHDLLAKEDGPLSGHRDTLGEFLRHCDLAKFARWQLSTLQMEEMLQSARDFILSTAKPPKESCVKASTNKTKAMVIVT